jgi:hypothetical protein
MTTPVGSPVAGGSHGAGRPWADFFAEDPRPWVLSSGEPAARWALLTGVLGLPPDGALLCDSHAIIEVLVRFGFTADPGYGPGWTG